MSNLIAWIIRAIPFGTIIMFGSMGEITTEKSGNLNLGVPGIMYLGGFAGFASSYFYEKRCRPKRVDMCGPGTCSSDNGFYAWWTDFQLPDHHLTCKPECNRSCTDNLWYGCCQLLRCIYPQWRQLYSGTTGLRIFFKEDPVFIHEVWCA